MASPYTVQHRLQLGNDGFLVNSPPSPPLDLDAVDADTARTTVSEHATKPPRLTLPPPTTAEAPVTPPRSTPDPTAALLTPPDSAESYKHSPFAATAMDTPPSSATAAAAATTIPAPSMADGNGAPTAEIGLPVEFKEKKKRRKPVKPAAFEDKYELTGVTLGSGASCVVHECSDREHSAMFAVKVVLKSTDSFVREQVLQEVALLLECKGQPNILQLIDFYETDEDFKLVFEKVVGGELLTHIQERRMFTEHEASMVIRDIAGALTFLHSHGIAHRDLKPQNILCVHKNRASPAKLCDFNLGTRLPQTGNRTPTINIPVGTPEFMAPEVVDGLAGAAECRYDKRCDVWSLGVILYIMLSGYPPFSGDCGSDCGWKDGKHCEFCQELLQEQIQDGHFDFPAPEWTHISGAAKDLIARMLVREDRRITSAQILLHPWVRQEAPRTPLITPDLLRQKSTRESLDEFASDANALNRRVDSNATAPSRGSRVDSLRRDSLENSLPRSRPVMVPSSFKSVETKDIADIHTPRTVNWPKKPGRK